jgi:hypothetical protein
MRRKVRRDENATPAKGDTAFEHSSRHADLKALLDEHAVDPDAPTMAEWLPSRRGNSARSAPKSAE